jgi:acyl-lipid omega-3 desaturase
MSTAYAMSKMLHDSSSDSESEFDVPTPGPGPVNVSKQQQQQQLQNLIQLVRQPQQKVQQILALANQGRTANMSSKLSVAAAPASGPAVEPQSPTDSESDNCTSESDTSCTTPVEYSDSTSCSDQDSDDNNQYERNTSHRDAQLLDISLKQRGPGHHEYEHCDLNSQQVPFPTLAELKRSIPAYCFKSNPLRSFSYVARDAVIIALLVYSLVEFSRSYGPFQSIATTPLYAVVWPLYWFLQGTMFWAVFVLGHDCGHGSFSTSPSLNFICGLLLHTSILVPYTPWQVSHRHHHKNTCNIDRDEIFYPIRESAEDDVSILSKNYSGLGLGWFGYIFMGYFPRPMSHLNALSPMFRKHHVVGSVISVSAWFSAVAFLFAATNRSFLAWTSFSTLAVYYLAPLFVFASWLVITTFLHHNDSDTPWYGDEEWTYVKGNLSSIDRDYGWLHNVVHSIGTHQVHHLFPIIPHYHLRDATRAFRAAFPHLIRTSSESILPAFFRVHGIFQRAGRIPDDIQEFQYSDVQHFA